MLEIKKPPVLLVLAAGMGSRFGGLKQITPVDSFGHAIIDFSLFDAYQAGFRDVVFIIKPEIENDFKAVVGKRMERYFNVTYVFQTLDKMLEGRPVPEGRSKPWGTGHAIACCSEYVNGPFAVINSDDFYGPTAYSALYGFLKECHGDNEHAMVSYLLKNTVTETGYVSRGICSVKDGFLYDIVEHTKIEKNGINATCIDGDKPISLDGNTPVSMNCWAFGASMMKELTSRFGNWFDNNVSNNPLKAEYFLPSVANAVIKEKTGTVKVLECSETWHGVTYREDITEVEAAISDMRSKGLYPDILLD